MNTDIAIFRRLIEEFASHFPRFDDHAKIIAYLYNGYCDSNSGSTDFATYKTDHFCLPSKIPFCEHSFECVAEFVKGGELRFYQSELSAGVKLPKDDETLLQFLSLFSLLAVHGEDASQRMNWLKASL